MKKLTAKNKQIILDMNLIAMFAIIIAACSWINIPTSVVPFTLQTFGVALAVGILGGKRGTISVILYIVLGLIGVPVFAGFSGGIATIMGPTGGYIVGFIFMALIMWLFEKLLGKKSYITFISMIVGILVCYAFGTAWFMIVYNQTKGSIGLWSALMACVIPYLIPDLIKFIIAIIIVDRTKFLQEKISHKKSIDIEQND